MYYFMDSGPKFTGLVSLNAGGIVLDNISFRFWISGLIPETFAIKVGSCVKSAQILQVFWPQKFLGRYPEFLDLHYKIQPHIDHVAGAVFRPRSTRSCGGRRRWKGPKGSGDEN